MILPGDAENRESNDYLWMRAQLPEDNYINPFISFRSVDQIFEVYLDGKRIYHFGENNNQTGQGLARAAA